MTDKFVINFQTYVPTLYSIGREITSIVGEVRVVAVNQGHEYLSKTAYPFRNECDGVLVGEERGSCLLFSRLYYNLEVYNFYFINVRAFRKYSLKDRPSYSQKQIF